MRALIKSLGLLLLSVLLASCGGGGSNGSAVNSPVGSGNLIVTATTTQLPVNTGNVGPFFGSPYMSEVTITWRRPNGDLQLGQKISVAMSNVQIAAFSTLDDPATTTINEFQQLLGSGPVDATNGVATIFVSSGSVSGTSTLTVSAKAPDSNLTTTTTLNFTVVNATPRLPAAINLFSLPSGIYLSGSGGKPRNASMIFIARLRNPART